MILDSDSDSVMCRHHHEEEQERLSPGELEEYRMRRKHEDEENIRKADQLVAQLEAKEAQAAQGKVSHVCWYILQAVCENMCVLCSAVCSCMRFDSIEARDEQRSQSILALHSLEMHPE